MRHFYANIIIGFANLTILAAESYLVDYSFEFANYFIL